MTRHAFRMQLKPGVAEEYKRRHDDLWTELAAALTDAGISNYEIFLDEATGALFAVLSLADDHRRDALPDLPVMRRWWAWMAPLMEVASDDRPLEWPLTPMFHLA